MSSIRKSAFRFIKRSVGDQRARRFSITARRSLYRARLKPKLSTTHAIHIPGKGAFVSGNIVDINGKTSTVELILSDGQVIDVTQNIIRNPSSTLFGTAARGKNNVPAGFTVYAPYPNDIEESVSATAIRLQLKNGGSVLQRISFVDSAKAPLLHVQKILSKVPAQSDNKRNLFDAVYGPALQAIWHSRDNARPAVFEAHYNHHLASDQPDVSVIVPIYGRYDFIEYQLSLFVRDPDMARHEIIYVIDDPRLHDEINVSCDALARIYPIAFRVLRLERNMGYAGANNVGVEHAKGHSVLLLNSDVMPENNGWLRNLLNTVGDSLSHSITGARLLYEDRTVQHDGMSFFASPFMNNLWTNIHPGKGMPVDVFPETTALVQKEAVTGACLLLTRENYDRLGGLDEGYILGDFEDSDLCLAAHENSLNVQLAPSIQLFHLERLSQSLVAADRWKEEVTYFNCWQHHSKWNSEIEGIKAKVNSAHTSTDDSMNVQQENVIVGDGTYG